MMKVSVASDYNRKLDGKLDVEEWEKQKQTKNMSLPLRLPTPSHTAQDAWNAPGSPFQGTDFDPTMLNLSGPVGEDFFKARERYCGREVFEREFFFPR